MNEFVSTLTLALTTAIMLGIIVLVSFGFIIHSLIGEII